MTQLSYTNTVLSKPIEFATNTPWDMFLYTGTVPYKEQVYVYVSAGVPGQIQVLIPLTTLQFDITVFPTSIQQFTLDILVTPIPSIWTHVIIFRRAQGAYQPYEPGNPLTAESLNNRFNLLTLVTNDLEYYQKLTIPRYRAAAIIDHGVSLNPLDGMKIQDLELPYLGAGATVGDIYGWGKRITNTPAAGDGYFEPVKLESTNDPDLPNFIAKLGKQCVPAPDLPGSSLVGICAPAPVSGGPGMTLHEYINVGLVSAVNAASSGAQAVGAFFGGAPSTVQSALTSLKTDVDANTSGIATNQTNILTNASNIGINTQNIAANTLAITANTNALDNGVPLRSHFTIIPVTVPSTIVYNFNALPAPFNVSLNLFKIVFTTENFDSQITFYYDFNPGMPATVHLAGTAAQSFFFDQLTTANNGMTIISQGSPAGTSNLNVAFFAQP